VAGWVVTSKLKATGVTSKMNIQYLKPISTREQELTIRARVNHMMRNVAFIDAEIINGEGEICSKSELIYFCKMS
jgi:acyl-coenzyme A thioesterase PaaI-like protein